MTRARRIRATGLCAMLVLAAGSLIGTGLAAPVATSPTTRDASTKPAQSLDVGRVERLFEQVPPPRLTAKAWLVHDESTDTAVAGVDVETPRPIASLTKLMTALVVTSARSGEMVQVPAAVNDIPADAAIMDLRPGERWSRDDLLRAMLVYSANDAALALAVHVSASEAAFVDEMNARARTLGLTSTRFASATGLDLTGALSTSSPNDLVTLTRAALDVPAIATAVGTATLELTRPGAAASAPTITLDNRNPLLGRYPGVDGVKTGFTEQAGYMLITHDVDERTKGRLIVVTASSTSEATRASDARALLDWSRALRQRVLVREAGAALATIPVHGYPGKRVRAFVCDDVYATVLVGTGVVTSFEVPSRIEPPISAGDELGRLVVRAHGADVGTGRVCSRDTFAKPDRRQRARVVLTQMKHAWTSGAREMGSTWSKLAG